MNPFEMVVLIVAIVTIGSIMRGRSRHRHLAHDEGGVDERAETRALREEVAQLKDRIKVLERIAVDKEDTLTRQIEQLRDR